MEAPAEHPHPAPAAIERPEPSWRQRTRRWARNALIVSVVVHLAFGIVAGFVVAFRSRHKPQAVFMAEPLPRPTLPVRKLDMRVKPQDLAKRSSRPKMKPRLAAVSPSELALPEIKKIPKQHTKTQRDISVLGRAGIGTGIGGGVGTGQGAGLSFFGVQAAGRRVAFVVDFSHSMKEPQRELLRNELVSTLKQLAPGMNYQIIPFAGPAWFLGDTVGGVWPNFIIRSGRKEVRWEPTQARIWMPPGGWDSLEPGEWLVASPTQIEDTIKKIDAVIQTQIVGGTAWEGPMRMALLLDPPADLIYLMTDGSTPGAAQQVERITELNQQRNQATIHTIGMLMNPSDVVPLENLAKENGGEFNHAGGDQP